MMNRLTSILLFQLLVITFALNAVAQRRDPPLIDSVPVDLVVPELESGEPAPGKRVRQTLPDWQSNQVYHTIYLPTDFDETKKYCVIVEYAGNGNFKNNLGDISTGLVDGSKLGYGICAGVSAIWVCMPYLNNDGDKVAITWWGDPPEYDVKATLDYCKQAVPWICDTYHGDPGKVILAGFSRGAIACNYLGLHDDEIAKLWCGFVAYSHYDGVKHWPYPDCDRDSAIGRLKRLGGRPQFICAESSGGLEATRQWLESTGIEGDFTYTETGFRNHNDAWLLRPSEARTKLRKWFAQF